MLIHLRKQLYLQAITLIAVIIFISCKKDINNNTNPVNETPDLTTKVTSSVSGFVTDENNAAVQGADVKAGTAAPVVTDQYGYFEIKNVELVKAAAFVTVTKAGYFKGIKTWAITAGKAAFFRIKLLPKTNAGTIDGSSGGNVTLSNGLVISLPQNAVVNAATNVSYPGNINVAVSWLNPEANDLTEIMPGDLRGIDDAGMMKGLTTFGMAAVELTGDAGQLLQIATGKKATITMPLSSLLSSAATSSIPLWYFDENNGLWKQDGVATKTGNTYVADVSHFSYWNCDLLNATVPLTFTVVDGSGNPVQNVHVEITPNSPNSWGHVGGWTDSTGYVSVFVTANTSYNLDVYGSCSNYGSTPEYTQSFSVTTTAVDLGNVVIGSATTAIVTGTITDCNGNPVTNGDMIVQDGYYYTRYPVDNNGAYNFSMIVCNGSTAVNLIAEDINNSQQNTPVAFTLVTGPNSIGNMQACGIITNTFINSTVDGVVTNLAPPVDTLWHTGNGGTAISYINGTSNGPNATFVALGFDNTGIATGTTQNLTNFSTSSINSGLETTGFQIVVNITEYGPIGGFIAGNFSGTVYDLPPGSPGGSLPYQVTCNFRVRRSQ